MDHGNVAVKHTKHNLIMYNLQITTKYFSLLNPIVLRDQIKNSVVLNLSTKVKIERKTITEKSRN